MNSCLPFENLHGRSLFFVESNELKPDLSLFVNEFARPQLLTIFPSMPRSPLITKYDAGIVHLTPKTIEKKPELSVDRIIEATNSHLPLVVLISLIGDPDNLLMNRLVNNGVEAYPNNDTSSFMVAMGRLNAIIGPRG